MGVALTIGALQATNTLAGLMASMSIQGPSIIAVMGFISIFNIEIGSTRVSSNFSTVVQAAIPPITKMDATNVIFSKTQTPDWFFRELDLTSENNFSRGYLVNK